MEGVLVGFSVVTVLTLVGTATAAASKRMAVLLQRGLTPLVYYLTNPALMVVLVSETDVTLVAGLYTPLALGVAGLTGVAFTAYGLAFRRSSAEIAVGAMASSYVNAGNIGVPIALYMVGSTAPVVAVLLAQLIVIAPLYLMIFGILASRMTETPAVNRCRMVIGSLLNPTTLGVISGVLLSVLSIELPAMLWQPLRMLGEASIPLMLLIFGISLWQQRPFGDSTHVQDSIVAGACKALVMPLVAWVLAGPMCGLGGSELLGVVVMAALPTAQNVLLFGLHYRMPLTVVKDTVFISAIISLPVILAAAWLLSS